MPGKSAYAKLAVFVAAVAAVIALDAAFGLGARLADDATWVALRDVLEDNAAAAVVVFCLATVVGCVVLALPGAVFAVAAALLFGPFWGTVWCVASAWAGAVAAFLAGRYFLRDVVRERAVRNDLLRRWLFSGSLRNEVVTLAVTRLVPLFPFNVQNFAYGATDMSLATYAACTFAFMIPGTALYAYGAAGLLDAGNRAVYLGVAVVLAAALIVIGVVLKRRYLDA